MIKRRESPTESFTISGTQRTTTSCGKGSASSLISYYLPLEIKIRSRVLTDLIGLGIPVSPRFSRTFISGLLHATNHVKEREKSLIARLFSVLSEVFRKNRHHSSE